MAQVTLSIQNVDDETDLQGLFPAHGKDYRFEMFAPLIIKQDGQIKCLHRLVVHIPDKIKNQEWQSAYINSHNTLDQKECALTMAGIYAKVGMGITNGKIVKSIEAGNKETDEEDDETTNNLKDVLKATLS